MQYNYLCFFNDTATTEIYTLSLHDALPIFHVLPGEGGVPLGGYVPAQARLVTRHPYRHVVQVGGGEVRQDRKSTRLNSSHANISYAVFCLKKKKKTHTQSCP